MPHQDQYLTLMASLPAIGPLFGSTQTPLSRIKLDQRLTLLDEPDRQVLSRVEQSVFWSYQPLGRSDAHIIQSTRQWLEELHNPLLHELVCFRLEMRTAIAALRRRHRGEEAPPVDQRWGFGRWLNTIRQHWHEPAFRLEGVFPWLAHAEQLLHEGDALALERLLLSSVWQHLDRASHGHYFDFEAVVIYVLRWSIIQRWIHYDSQIAARRFQSLVEAGLGEYATLFPEDC